MAKVNFPRIVRVVPVDNVMEGEHALLSSGVASVAASAASSRAVSPQPGGAYSNDTTLHTTQESSHGRGDGAGLDGARLAELAPLLNASARSVSSRPLTLLCSETIADPQRAPYYAVGSVATPGAIGAPLVLSAPPPGLPATAPGKGVGRAAAAAVAARGGGCAARRALPAARAPFDAAAGVRAVLSALCEDVVRATAAVLLVRCTACGEHEVLDLGAPSGCKGASRIDVAPKSKAAKDAEYVGAQQSVLAYAEYRRRGGVPGASAGGRSSSGGSSSPKKSKAAKKKSKAKKEKANAHLGLMEPRRVRRGASTIANGKTVFLAPPVVDAPAWSSWGISPYVAGEPRAATVSANPWIVQRGAAAETLAARKHESELAPLAARASTSTAAGSAAAVPTSASGSGCTPFGPGALTAQMSELAKCYAVNNAAARGARATAHTAVLDTSTDAAADVSAGNGAGTAGKAEAVGALGRAEPFGAAFSAERALAAHSGLGCFFEFSRLGAPTLEKRGNGYMTLSSR